MTSDKVRRDISFPQKTGISLYFSVISELIWIINYDRDHSSWFLLIISNYGHKLFTSFLSLKKIDTVLSMHFSVHILYLRFMVAEWLTPSPHSEKTIRVRGPPCGVCMFSLSFPWLTQFPLTMWVWDYMSSYMFVFDWWLIWVYTLFTHSQLMNGWKMDGYKIDGWMNGLQWCLWL